MDNLGTYFFDSKGDQLASDVGIIPIPLYKGMEITFHGLDGSYEVVSWNYHHGHTDEKAGLRVIVMLSE